MLEKRTPRAVGYVGAWVGCSNGEVPMLAKHAKVMVVEDNEVVRELIVHVLEAAGCVVVTATNGEHAWLMVVNDPPDLMIVDFHMPALEGSDLIDRVRRYRATRLAHIPIIGITGIPAWSEKLKLAGATEVVSKPFTATELTTAVRRHVRCEPC